MALQTPPRSSVTKVDDGVIEEARRRQRRHQTAGLVLLALLSAGLGLIVGFGAGGSGGRGGSGRHGSSPGSPGPGNAALHGANPGFAGMPVSQNAALAGVSGWECPLAPANRYLPARSGCVTALRANVTGDGRADLVIAYSHLNHESPAFPGEPRRWKHYFGAEAATLEVVLPGGRRISTRITTPYRGHAYPVRAAAIIALRHVSDTPGEEIFLEISQISSGAGAVAYGLQGNRLIPAGVLLSYGGDSGSQAGFSCQATSQAAELIQRQFSFGAQGARGRWQETQITYAWRGLKLLRRRTDTLSATGRLPLSDIEVGKGCGPLAGTNRTARLYARLLNG